MRFCLVPMLLCVVLLLGCSGKIVTDSAEVVQLKQTIEVLENRIAELRSGLNSCETSFEKYQQQQKIQALENKKDRYEYELLLRGSGYLDKKK